MRFSQVMAGVVREGDMARGEVDTGWLQGRSAFGGLQAALGLRAMRHWVPAALPLRALQVTFIGPVPVGPVAIRVHVLRQGKHTMHVEADLLDGAQVACRLLGVFGAARSSRLAIVPTQPEVTAQSMAPVLRYVEGRMPSYMQHFNAHWLQGDLPFSGGQQRASVIALDLCDEAPVTEAHVVAAADFVPPIALSLLDQPVPGSSVTWMIELLRDHFDDLPLTGWRVDAALVAARDGYTQQHSQLWGPAGEPLALSRQTMVVFG